MPLIKRQHHQGFQLITAETEHASVTVIPELGARIMSLRDLHGGREWLWRPDGPLRLWRNLPGDPFPLGTFAGADECLPTIAPCTWQGRELPDHGEAWNQSWTLDEAALEIGCIKTSLTLPRSPFHFSRTLTLENGVLRLDYALQNVGSTPEAWLWAWHPLMTLEPGDRLSVPYDATSLRVETARRPNAARGEWWPWPEPKPGVHLDKLELGGSGDSYLKAFAGPLQEGWARLENPSSDACLTLRWDAARLPYLGLWLTRGGYQGWHHVALEPTNLPADSLADGVRENSPPPLAPGATVRWWLELTVGAAGERGRMGSLKEGR